MSKKSKTKKKEKVKYIDDGRSFADFSGTPYDKRKSSKSPNSYGKDFTGSKFKDSVHTYIQSVKLMFLPMLVTIGGICIIFLILWIVFSLGGFIA